METSLKKKSRNKNTIWSSSPTSGLIPSENPIQKDTCTPVFIAALFTVARKWKQPRCPLTDGWIKKMWYIYTMEYNSTIKMNKVESVILRWTNLEPVIQSEVSQKEKDTYVYRISKNSTDEPIYRKGMETQTRRTDLWTQWEKGRMEQIEKVALTYTHYLV